MKKLGPIVLALVGVVFLVSAIIKFTQGEPLSLTPALAAGLGFLLGAIAALVVGQKSDGGPGSPPTPDAYPLSSKPRLITGACSFSSGIRSGGRVVDN
jgi:hypothetical protein